MPRSGLAHRIGTTSSFLSQVMAPLVRAGWVESDRGPGGGYQLAESAIEARLLEVIEATEGPTAEGRCVMRNGPCPGEETCPIHAAWLEAKSVLVDGLDEVPALPHPTQGRKQ